MSGTVGVCGLVEFIPLLIHFLPGLEGSAESIESLPKRVRDRFYLLGIDLSPANNPTLELSQHAKTTFKVPFPFVSRSIYTVEAGHYYSGSGYPKVQGKELIYFTKSKPETAYHITPYNVTGNATAIGPSFVCR